MDTLNILFAGTPDFAAFILKDLIASEHTIQAVLTQPDRPKGRGKKVQASPVKQLAISNKLPVHQPENSAGIHRLIADYTPDVLVVVAYGLLLSKAVLDSPRYGCINIHPSLLPKERGPAPIPQSILNGDTQTGMTIMLMEEALDSGPILMQTSHPLLATDTTMTLSHSLAKSGSDLLLKTLANIENTIQNAKPQNHKLATYTKKLKKQDAHIDWNQPAHIIDRKIRAYNPTPIAYTLLNKEPLRIWQCELTNMPTKKPPGTIIEMSKQGIEVATSENSLRLCEIQMAGGKRLQALDIYNGLRKKLPIGTVFNK